MTRFTKAILLSSALGFLGAGSIIGPAHAGFEWVPMNKKEEPLAPQAPEAAPISPVEPVLQAPINESMNEEAEPANMRTIKLLETQANNTDAQDAVAPMPGDPAPETVSRTPEPQIIKTKVIMPDDAPKAAENEVQETVVAPAPKAPKAMGLSINPFPVQNNQATEPAESIAFVEPVTVPSNTENSSPDIVQGFGSDMPLALALGQVVPSSYTLSYANGINPGLKVDWDGGKSWKNIVTDMLAPHGLKATINNGKVFIFSAAGQKAPAPVESGHSSGPARNNITDPGGMPNSHDNAMPDISEKS